jgi:hypothetical protein
MSKAAVEARAPAGLTVQPVAVLVGNDVRLAGVVVGDVEEDAGRGEIGAGVGRWEPDIDLAGLMRT